jgi:ribonuclease HII
MLKLLPFHTEGRIEAGCDEAGRGCLAGPVVAAAVILPTHYFHPLLNDSKQLNEKRRELLRLEIEKEAIAFGVSVIDESKIDEINILNASIYGMHCALDQLETIPDLILVDGNRFKKYHQTEHHCIIKGDGKYLSIAAASVLAKTYRDEIMKNLHEEFPVYAWNKNKGYPTAEHREGIRQHGPCKYHRASFTLLPPEQLKLF